MSIKKLLSKLRKKENEDTFSNNIMYEDDKRLAMQKRDALRKLSEEKNDTEEYQSQIERIARRK